MRYAENLLRMKGIVLFDGESEPQLLNAVHNVFTSDVATGSTTSGLGARWFLLAAGFMKVSYAQILKNAWSPTKRMVQHAVLR